MTKLSVNLNKIALLRNSRGRNFPNIISFGEQAIKAGADGLTIHPRPDQRHARYDDINKLKNICDNYQVELNIEGYPTPKLVDLCLRYQVDQVTLVPDSPEQITSDHGWIVSKNANKLQEILAQLKSSNIRSSLFMDLSISEIHLAKDIGADRIELHTESYARSFASKNHLFHIEAFVKAYQTAVQIGLEVNAGHDLDLINLDFFLAKVPVMEVSIGHALTVESLNYGWQETIRRYKKICNKTR